MIQIDPMYWYWKDELSEDLCEAIIQEGLKINQSQGSVGGDTGYTVNLSIRNSNVSFLKSDSWIGAITKYYMEKANSQAWNFEITGQQDPQFTIYEPNQFYDMHSDSSKNENNMRKLSMVVSLSDPKYYNGGDFEFFDGTKPDIRGRGSVLVFPSFLRHKVNPVTNGVRYSLVNWFTGDRFK